MTIRHEFRGGIGVRDAHIAKLDLHLLDTGPQLAQREFGFL
jgi:hypothetical protein